MGACRGVSCTRQVSVSRSCKLQHQWNTANFASCNGKQVLQPGSVINSSSKLNSEQQSPQQIHLATQYRQRRVSRQKVRHNAKNINNTSQHTRILANKLSNSNKTRQTKQNIGVRCQWLESEVLRVSVSLSVLIIAKMRNINR